MSADTKKLARSPLEVVKGAEMPTYRYQAWNGGSGSLSSRDNKDREKRLEELRALNLA